MKGPRDLHVRLQGLIQALNGVYVELKGLNGGRVGAGARNSCDYTKTGEPVYFIFVSRPASPGCTYIVTRELCQNKANYAVRARTKLNILSGRHAPLLDARTLAGTLLGTGIAVYKPTSGVGSRKPPVRPLASGIGSKPWPQKLPLQQAKVNAGT